MNILPASKQVAIVAALTEGVSIRATERLTDTHRDTVMRLGIRVGLGCAALHDRLMRNLHVTAEMWQAFRAGFAPLAQAVWTERLYTAQVLWEEGAQPPGSPVHVRAADGELPYVLTPDARVLGRMNAALNPARKGLLRATVNAEAPGLLVNYIGPDDLWLA